MNNLEIIDFKCWWFRGEEALTLAFLQELNAVLKKNLGDKVKELIPRLGKKLLQTGPVVGPAVNLATGGIWGALTSGSMDFTKKFFSETEGAEKVFNRLVKILDEQKKRFLVIIDDIDRLTPDEAILVFRLIKSVGRLPNVMYLLVFDRELAENTVSEMFPSEGPHFLEKIIQASFEVPLPTRDDLNAAALSRIQELCQSEMDTNQLRRFMNIFYDVIAPYINTPRDLTRLSNSMTIAWPPVAREVNVEDFVALEAIRLFDVKLYNKIRSNKNLVCGTGSDRGGQTDKEKEMSFFVDVVPEQKREQAKVALMRLFPRFENVGYSSSFMQEWEAQRQVCTEKHFDTYFRMSLGDDVMSITELEDFIECCGEVEFVKKEFTEAVKKIRKNGKSKVPLLLDELNCYALKIDVEKYEPLFTAIFGVADEIHREEDRERGGFSIGDNFLRIHWLLRKTLFDRCDLEERSKILCNACKNAQLGWLLDFTSSAINDHFPRPGKNPEPQEKCLVKKECIEDLKNLALIRIGEHAENETLLDHSQLLHILFRWRDFSDDNGASVKEWTKKQIENNESLSKLAKEFTGESWSQGIGMVGLGDRVAVRNVRASVDGINDLLDVAEFRQRLEDAQNDKSLGDEQRDAIRIFLDAWKKQEDGDD